MHSHSLRRGTPLPNIWSHGEILRFITVDVTIIIIWEVGFTSGAAPTEVETLPAPDAFYTHQRVWARFFPTSWRLALTFTDKVLVWDVRNSKYLLRCTDAKFDGPVSFSDGRTSFSSDGRFFACSTTGSDIYFWKESPTGYLLRGILASTTAFPNLLISQDGEWIVVFGGRTIRLWRTKSFATLPSGIPTKAPQRTRNFVLDLLLIGCWQWL